MTAYQDRIPIASTGSSARRTPAPKPKSNELTGQTIKNAIAFNNDHWRDPHRSELLAKLRVEKGEPRFDAGDVIAIAELPKREGTTVDRRLSGPTMASLLNGGLHLSEVKAKPEEVVLVFYPGEFEDLAAWHKAKADAIAANGGKPLGDQEYPRIMAPPGHGTIYVQLRGNVVAAIPARGGPPIAMKDVGGHMADPSKAGRYKLGAGRAVTTPMWDGSEIAWGASIREVGGQVQFRNPGQDWRFATGPQSKLKLFMERSEFLDSDGLLVKEWRKNAFGRTAFQIMGSPGLFVHAVPDGETALQQEKNESRVHERLALTHSHGCLHVDPDDRNRMIHTGYLQKGVTLVIKRYDESLDPSARNRP